MEKLETIQRKDTGRTSIRVSLYISRENRTRACLPNRKLPLSLECVGVFNLKQQSAVESVLEHTPWSNLGKVRIWDVGHVLSSGGLHASLV